MRTVSKTIRIEEDLLNKIDNFGLSRSINFSDSIRDIVKYYFDNYDEKRETEIEKELKNLPKRFVVDILKTDPRYSLCMKKYKDRVDKENIYDELVSENNGNYKFIYLSYHLFLSTQFIYIKVSPVDHKEGSNFVIFEGDGYYILLNRKRSFPGTPYRKRVFGSIQDTISFIRNI